MVAVKTPRLLIIASVQTSKYLTFLQCEVLNW